MAEPDVRSLVELLQVTAAERPDATAVTLRTRRAADEAISHAALLASARAAAARLRGAGLRPGDRVVLALPSGRAFLDGFFGALLAGGVPVPVAPPASVRRSAAAPVVAVATDCAAALLLAEPQVLTACEPGLQAAVPGLTLLAPGEGSAAEVPPARPARGDTALIQYTSGSTGEPKGVELSHGAVLANVAAITTALAPVPDDVTVSWLPPHHDMGLVGTVLTPLFARVPVVLLSPRDFALDPACWLRAISEHRGSITVAPSFAFDLCVRRVEAADLEGVRLDSLRVVLNGAEPVGVAAIRRFCQALAPFGLRDDIVRPVYGLAESTLAVTFSPPGPLTTERVDVEALTRRGQALPAGPGDRGRLVASVGSPLAGQAVRVVDPSGGPLPDGRVGEITVRGPAVMKGYYGRPAESDAALRDGWLHTGDLGYLRAGALFVTGRSKDVIIRHGRNFDPHDFEQLAAEVPGVVAGWGGAAAFSVDGPGGAAVVVCAETRVRGAPDRAAVERAIREWIVGAHGFAPDVVVLLAPGSIPRTTSGKVRRHVCRERFEAGELGDAPAQPGSRSFIRST